MRKGIHFVNLTILFDYSEIHPLVLDRLGSPMEIAQPRRQRSWLELKTRSSLVQVYRLYGYLYDVQII